MLEKLESLVNRTQKNLKNNTKKVISLSLLSSLLLPYIPKKVDADTFIVPDQFPTIEAAVNTANVSPGIDTIEVKPGTYNENILNIKDIYLHSTKGPDSTMITPILSGESLITILAGAESSTAVEGFTITKGTVPFSRGIVITSNSSPIIRNNVITDFITEGNFNPGGIIVQPNSNPLIENNVLRNNSTRNIYTGSSITIRNNRIYNNRGWGIVSDLSCPIIIGNEFSCDYPPSVLGGAISLYGSTGEGAVVEDNIFINNHASRGGAIGIAFNQSPILIKNNSFQNNSASRGGAIYITASFSPISIEDNTFEDNFGDFGGGIHLLSPFPNSSLPVEIRYNCFNRNGTGIYLDSRSTNIDTIHAENNFWGHETGPYHESNPGGQGDTIITFGNSDIIFNPWLDTCLTGIEDPGDDDDDDKEGNEIANPLLTNLLHQNSPNPFYESTLIQYILPKESELTLKVYDITGGLIKTLENGKKEAGTYTVTWDGTDYNGNTTSTGIYFLRLDADNTTATRKIILMR